MSRRHLDIETFRLDFVRSDADSSMDAERKWLAARLYHLTGEFHAPAMYNELTLLLEKVAKAHRTGRNCLFYLAIPPQLFSVAVKRLGDADLVGEGETQWRRVIIEKPFGRDLRSSHELNKILHSIFPESAIFRIDHYLGKDAVENILESERFRGCVFVNASIEFPLPHEPAHVAAAKSKAAFERMVRQIAERAGADDPAALAQELALILEGAYVTRHVSGNSQTIDIARRLGERVIAMRIPQNAAPTAGAS